MSKNQRKQYGSAFKTKVALEALRGEQAGASFDGGDGLAQPQGAELGAIEHDGYWVLRGCAHASASKIWGSGSF